MAKRRKPFVDNMLATLLRIYADDAAQAFKKRTDAVNRLSKLKMQSGISALESEIRKYEIEERTVFIEIQNLLQKYVPKPDRGNDEH